MPEFKYGSFCGLYCGACDILVAYRNGLETGEKPQWSTMPAELGNLPSTIRKSEIECHGCQSDTVFAGCSKCLIRKCAMKKTAIRTCQDCKRYPCWRFKLTDFYKRLLKLEEKLPHQKTIGRNMEVIRNRGVQVWLEEQSRRWQCPYCGKRLSWYRSACTTCRIKTNRDSTAINRP